ncbi:methyltransferase family protein [Hyphomonas adhaerens]|uniref:methyltransferase family protein n=1 Tax=Hyphomonas adhaerens TaxID=81029 RepID=UPI00235604C1|nr:isoprenylcysteine carboxylmethyltransferase family protein [Hyphomonas adhaerens]|tara:strand:- start:1681 stop:2358 length:678 start_codon:yes stop_codon:yes gene_type:complete
MKGEMAYSEYGLWFLVILNSAIFIIFAFSFAKPSKSKDWTSFGAFSAFVIALFTEMYGFPLSIYFLSPWLESQFPNINWFAHDSGHFWEMIFGWKDNPHFGPFHFISLALIFLGFSVLSSAWPVLHGALRSGKLATTGIYARMRHPQYAGFVLIMFGFLVQWPTILTLVMFPVLVFMYVRLALREEKDAEAEFGEEYRAYAANTPRFWPRWRRLSKSRRTSGPGL